MSKFLKRFTVLCPHRNWMSMQCLLDAGNKGSHKYL